MTEIKEQNGRPLVTFALFAYNQEKYIRKAIEGALAQTYEPLEVILSDDCSTDETFEIMQIMAMQYVGPHDVKVRRSESNKGLADHINQLVSEASGEIISWAAGDDIALASRTERLVFPMLQDGDIVGVHSAITEIGLNGKILGARVHDEYVKNINLATVCHRGTSVITQSHAFRKKVFEVFGPFSNNVTNEGPVMAFRETCLGKVAYIAESLTLYRVGSGTSTYDGNDLLRVRHAEPTKISNWRKSAFKQMQIDCVSLPSKISDDLAASLKDNVNFYENLCQINEKRATVRPLLKNIVGRPFDSTTARAVTRLLIPDWLYKLRVYIDRL